VTLTLKGPDARRHPTMTGLQGLKVLDDKRHNPAVGSRYGGTPLGRLLVVGLSHYGDEGDVRWPGFTHMIVGEVIEGKRKIPYFTKIAKLFRDDNGDAYSVKEFYPAVAFYNFLPDHFERPRQMTTQEQSKHPEAQRFLFKVIDELRPDHLIVTSENFWRLLPHSILTIIKSQGSATIHLTSISNSTLLRGSVSGIAEQTETTVWSVRLRIHRRPSSTLSGRNLLNG
jgi:hypothetical protein